MGYRNKPSKRAYRAMEFCTKWWPFAAVLVVSAGFAFVATLDPTGTTDSECKVRCHPVASETVRRDCFCLPDGEPAYTPPDRSIPHKGTAPEEGAE